MLILKNQVHETIWGGKKLTPYSDSSCEKIGHLYSTNCNANESNIILNGKYKNKTLNQYFDENKERFGLEQYEYFPLVIALVEANDNLSIQVHPDDETAPILNSSIKFGKCESWYFIDEPNDGSIFCGCLCKNMDELKNSIISNDIAKVTDRLSIKKGDYTYVVAGTLHAMSAGSLVYEIEENSGCTYRFYDFDRIDKNGEKRPLQIPEAYFSIRLNNKSCVKHYNGSDPIEERRYITWHFDSISKYKNNSETLQVFTVINGKSIVDGFKIQRGSSIILEPGEEIIIDTVEAIVAQPKRIY